MTEEAAKALRILYVEDDDGLARLMQKRMSRLGFVVDIVRTGEEALALHRSQKYHAILLDYTLPTMNGLDILRALAPVDGEPPVIMLTAGGNEQLAVEALQLGAEDYIIKDVNQTYLDLLPHVLNAAIIKLNLRKQNTSQRDELQFYVTELETRNAELHEEIAERAKLEIELRQAKDKAEEANIAKGEFLANMSHEIRTPMNAVIGLANILARENLSSRQREFVDTLQHSADLLLALLNDLLDISKIEAHSVELEDIPFQVGRLMHEISDIMSVRAREKSINLTFVDKRDEDCLYRGDPNRLRQVMLNLISNAVKFTDQGHIRVEVCAKNSGTLDHIQIDVEDSGIGIPLDKQSTIFEKFVQADSSINRKYGGTGLGLAITKTLVEMMGGTITVRSTPGQGAIFTIALSLAHTSAESQVQTTEATRLAGERTKRQTRTILIVEDYAPNVMVAGAFLDDFGYGYAVAQNGAEALEKIKGGEFAAVLMDVQMHTLNGLDTTRLLRKWEVTEGRSRLPVIGMTAHALTGDRERCIDAGMDDYLSKPFSPSEFQDKLAQYVH